MVARVLLFQGSSWLYGGCESSFGMTPTVQCAVRGARSPYCYTLYTIHNMPKTQKDALTGGGSGFSSSPATTQNVPSSAPGIDLLGFVLCYLIWAC